MILSLRELNARFKKVRIVAVDPTAWVDGVLSPSGQRIYFDTVETLAEADGIWFDCPCKICQEKEYKSWHAIGFEGLCPPDTYSKGSNGQDTRWKVVSGTGLDDLVLSPSIQRVGGCNWHGYVGFQNIPPGHAGDC